TKRSRVLWHILARVWWLRGRGPGRGFSQSRDRLCRRLARLRLDGSDDGVCRGSYLRRPFQPGGHDWPVERWALRHRRRYALHYCAGRWCHSGRCGLVADRLKPTWLDARGLCREWLWRSQPGEIRSRRLLRDRGGDDLLLPFHHYRDDLKGRGSRVCRHSDRPGADPDPSRLDSSNQHLSQPGAKHRPRALRRWRPYRAAVAVLGCANYWRGDRRPPIALDV